MEAFDISRVEKKKCVSPSTGFDFTYEDDLVSDF